MEEFVFPGSGFKVVGGPGCYGLFPLEGTGGESVTLCFILLLFEMGSR